MSGSSSHFRDLFAGRVGRETTRAFLIFGVLVVALVGIGGELVFRDLSLGVLRERLDLGRSAAMQIARDVSRVCGEGEPIETTRLWLHRERLKRLIQSRIAQTHFIRHVEVRDRFGVRLLYIAKDRLRRVRPYPRTQRTGLPGDLPELAGKIINVPLQQGPSGPGGEVRLGIAQDALQQELVELRRSLWVKIGVAGLLATGVLVLGLFYVLHLIRKNRNLEQARQSAARASYVGLLASGLAHEIRNPLNAMNMNLQMLEEEIRLEDPEQAELLESTKSEIKRLERLVNNFLTYARPARPRFESKDLNVIVREVMRLLEVDFRQSGIELAADLEPLLPNVGTDETQFKQALINLLVNARQVLKEGGTVALRTRAGSKGEVVLEIADDGPGIPEESRERIFEVFYSSRGGGTGLGLPIARQIVERHGGTIELESVEGRGTTFRIRLPMHHRREARSTPAPEQRA